MKGGRNLPLIDRFRLRFTVTEDCWIWNGAPASNGYGKFGFNGKTVSAHRMSYEMFVGQIPPGLTIDHLCRVRLCVNPNHLEAVPHRVNILRSDGPAAKGALMLTGIERMQNAAEGMCKRLGYEMRAETIGARHAAEDRLVTAFYAGARSTSLPRAPRGRSDLGPDRPHVGGPNPLDRFPAASRPYRWNPKANRMEFDAV